MDQFTSYRYPVYTSEGFVLGPAGRTSIAGPAEHADSNEPGQYISLVING